VATIRFWVTGPRQVLEEARFTALLIRNCDDHPEATTRGREALNERAQKFLDSTPGFVFTATEPVHVLRDLGYLPFTLGMPEQPPASIGYDVAQVRDGRIAVLYTLLNGFTDRSDASSRESAVTG